MGGRQLYRLYKHRWWSLPLCLALLLAGCPGKDDHQAQQQPNSVTVAAELAYEDSGGSIGCPGDSTKTKRCRPIVGVRVEVWRFAPRALGIWGWANDHAAETDPQGKFSHSFDFVHRDVTYALRVFPWNEAAQCCFGELADWVEPGVFSGPPRDSDKRNPIHIKGKDAGETAEFRYTWPTGWWAEAFNIVDTIRHGRHFVEQNRDAAEVARQPLHTAHVARGGCAHLAGASCMHPVSGDIFIEPGSSAWNDHLILHEYGHWLQYDIGSFAWIASSHSGCAPDSVWIFGGGAPPPQWRAQHAWMEGFADWFALAMNQLYGKSPGLSGDLGGASSYAGESTSCNSSDPGDSLERHVANMLWDLTDPANPSEPQDTVDDQHQLILRVMDEELGTPSTREWPTALEFYLAARERHFKSSNGAEKALIDIYKLNGVRTPPPGTTPPTTTPPCDPRISDFKLQITRLQAQIPGASPEEKKYILAEIKMLQREVSRLEAACK